MSFQKNGKGQSGAELIGFIGQGFIGKNYADDFEGRGFEVVRYATRAPFSANKDKLKDCDIVFIAVPTPSTPKGFDDSIVREVARLVGKGKIAVIKSTIVPGTTASIQKENPGIFVLHSPEFLTEANAAHDAAHPERNIIGIPKSSPRYKKAALRVLATLPRAPYQLICDSDTAEFVKYAGNALLYLKVVFANLLYDAVEAKGAVWKTVRDAVAADKRIGPSHLDPTHGNGRGAGGHCFIKDFAALSNFYETLVGDPTGTALLRALRDKNNELLVGSGKDLDLLAGVYGEKIRRSKRKR